MTSFVKRELLRHLTRFAKNVDPAKVNISAVRGEGELNGLELDEVVLMDLLELPTWLSIKSANCNRLTIKIPWTSLKSKSISIYLDCVRVVMETCENLRPPAKPTHPSMNSNHSEGGPVKYGFVERVVDGVFVHVSSVVISFTSYAFSANIDLSQIVVESTNPNWEKPDDLRKTRVKDETRGQVIIFKRIQLGVIRIALNALDPQDAPILLISNNSYAEVSIKKRLLDCAFIASKLKFVIEDLLWVLNDSQIKAVISYFNMLKPLIMRAHKESQQHNTSLKSSPDGTQLQHGAISAANAANSASATFRLPKNDQEVKMCKIFDINDIHETSYHLVCRKIDFHLVEDNSNRATLSNAPLRLEGGALQLSLRNLCVDHYPYHLVGQTFYHWENYSDLFEERNIWANQLIVKFKDQYLQLKKEGKLDENDGSGTELNFFGSNPVAVEAKMKRPKKAGGSVPSKGAAVPPQPVSSTPQKLMSSCFVLFLDSYALHHVTSNKSSGSELLNGRLIYSDKSTFHIPSDMPSILAFYTDYYFTQSSSTLSSSSSVHASSHSAANKKNPLPYQSYAASGKQTNSDYGAFKNDTHSSTSNQPPLPHANLHVKFNPFCIDFDPSTLVWLNAFAKRISRNVEIPEIEKTEAVPHVDLKVEYVMPQVKLTVLKHPEEQSDRPRGLEVAMSRLTLTNVHDKNKQQLKQLTDNISNQNTFLSNEKTSFKFHSLELTKAHLGGFSATAKPIEPRGSNMLRFPGFFDIVFVEVDQIWVDWYGIKTTRLGRSPFLDPISFTMFISYPGLQRLHLLGTPSLPGSPPSTSSEFPQSNGYNNQEDDLSTNQDSSVVTSHGSVKKNEPLIQVIFSSQKRLTLYFDHYQFIVLMRIQEMVVETLDLMEQDTKLILGDEFVENMKNRPEVKISVFGLFPFVDIVFVMPPLPESFDLMSSRRSCLLATHDFNDIDSNAQQMSDEKMLQCDKNVVPLLLNGTCDAGDVRLNGCASSEVSSDHIPGLIDPLLNRSSNVEAEDEGASLGTSPISNRQSLPAASSPVHLQVVSSHSEQSRREPQLALNNAKLTPSDKASIKSTSASSLSNIETSSINSKQRIGGSDRRINNQSSLGISTSSSAIVPSNSSTGGSKVSLSTWTSAAGSFTAKFVSSHASAAVGKTLFATTDTMSITGSEFSTGSGYSSDDDFICLSTEINNTAGSFTKLNTPNYDLELKPANTYKPEEEFLGEERNDMPVSIMVARLCSVESSIQLLPDKGCSVVTLAVPQLNLDHYQNTTFSKFQTINAKYDSNRTDANTTSEDDRECSKKVNGELNETRSPSASSPSHTAANSKSATIEVRLDSLGPISNDLYGPDCVKLGHLAVNVNRLKLDQLKMSSLLGILDLIEDELVQPVAPLDLNVTDSWIVLNEDRPPTNPLTSPGPVPLKLKLSNLSVHRDEDLTMHISNTGIGSSHVQKERDPLTGKELTEDNANNRISASQTMTRLKEKEDQQQMSPSYNELLNRNAELEQQLIALKMQLAQSFESTHQLETTVRNLKRTITTHRNSNGTVN